MRPTNPIDRLSDLVGRAFSYVFLLSILVMVFEVISRYLFNAPTIWAQDSTTALTATGFALGGVYTMQQRGHISITIIYACFPPRIRALLDVFIQGVILFFLCALIYGGVLIAERSWSSMETSGSAWNQPTPVLLKTVLVVGAALMVLQASVHLLQAIRSLVRGGEEAQ